MKRVAGESSRRRFLQNFAAGAGIFAATSTGDALSSFNKPRGNGALRAASESAGEGASLLTDPRFQVGAKFRMKQFIQKGAGPKEAAAIFGSLPNLDPQPWVDAWSRAAKLHEQRGGDLEKQGNMSEASQAFEKASFYYGIAKFPVINHPAKQAAYKKCIETYLQAAKYFDPPMERVTIPFEGREIVGYLRLPKGIKNPAVVIATGRRRCL